MGFFRDISLDVHVRALATLFAKLREEQFSCILHNVEHVVGEHVISERRTLKGETDICLKAFQYWILIVFVSQHSYVPKPDYDKFNGMVMKHCWNLGHDVLGELFKEIDEHRENPAEQIVRVAIPIADYMLEGRKDPRVWAAIGQTLAAFSLQTEIVIANEFGDKHTSQQLQMQLETLCSMSERRG
jgi:hypothetical protein